MTLADIIRERLEKNFSPKQLTIIDDSEKHKGHPGARGGGLHFTVIIAADCFKNCSRIEAHRQIYQVLNDLIPEKIHALSIKIF